MVAVDLLEGRRCYSVVLLLTHLVTIDRITAMRSVSIPIFRSGIKLALTTSGTIESFHRSPEVKGDGPIHGATGTTCRTGQAC